jgi:hypothetical protein
MADSPHSWQSARAIPGGSKVMDKQSSIATRDEAQSRIDQIEVFERELAHLRADRVIELTDAQLTAITAYHRHTIRSCSALRRSALSASPWWFELATGPVIFRPWLRH